MGLLFVFLVVTLAALGLTAGDDGRPVRFCAVGDVLLDRGVRKAMEAEGADALLKDAAPLLRGHDLALFNLECPASDLGFPLAKRFSFRGDPAALPALRAAGFNVAGLANNHALDCGRDALMDTMGRLEQAGIRPVGAGKDERSAAEGRIFEVRGVKVAVLAFLAMPLEGVAEAPLKPSVAPASEETIAGAVRRAKRKAHAVVVSFHWGREFDGTASIHQRALARLAVDSGASLVLGHHSHVLQGVEKYRGTLIFYGLGGFLFDLNRPEARQAALFECLIGKGGVAEARLVPFVVEKCHPRPADGDEATAILQRVASLSEEGGITLERQGNALKIR